jgi:hypothetical protein
LLGAAVAAEGLRQILTVVVVVVLVDTARHLDLRLLLVRH